MATQLIKGNSAIVVGALCRMRLFFGYPITPASEILHDASKYFPMMEEFVQAESAAINMVYRGASGHRVMTSSSGPGLA